MHNSLKKLLKAAFPRQYEQLMESFLQRKRLRLRREEYNDCKLPERACHLRGLFIGHEGGVYPCCLIWGDPRMRIGHVKDPDIYDKIAAFQEQCHCGAYKLRKGLPGEKAVYELLNIEVSLACQGKCAMCCVGAPDWQGEYNYYGEVTKFLEHIKPERIRLQGGEVLIQKKCLEWLYQLKSWSKAELSLVTNGNVGLDMIDTVEDLFKELIVSVFGFEPETYRKITGMDVRRTIMFCEELEKRGKVRVYPKYLITPICLHETALFLDWAIRTGFKMTFLAEADILPYLNMKTPDQFWQKIIDRTGHDIQAILIKRQVEMHEKRLVVDCEREVARLFGITDDFLRENGLESSVVRSERGMSVINLPG